MQHLKHLWWEAIPVEICVLYVGYLGYTVQYCVDIMILIFTFLLQFFMELMKLPRVESKLRVFSFKIQFRSQVMQLVSFLILNC